MIALPSGWSVTAIGNLTSKVRKVDPVDTGRQRIRYVDIGLLDGPTTNLSGAALINAATAPTRCRQVVAPGDTLYSTVRPYLRKIGYVGEDLADEFASTGFCVLRPNDDIDSKYLFYFVQSRQFEDQIFLRQKGVSYPAVLDREVKAQLIPYPGLDEQRRIVELLEEHLSHIDAGDTQLRVAARRTEMVHRTALEPVWLRASVWSTISEWGVVKTGTTPRSGALGTPLAFVTPGDVGYGGEISSVARSVNVQEGKATRHAEPNSCFVVCIGATIGKTGYRRDRSLFNQQVNVVETSRLGAARVLAGLLATPSGQRSLLTEVASTTLPILNKSKFSRVRVPKLDGKQVEQAADLLGATEAAHQRLLGQLAAIGRRSASLRRAVLAAAFEGKLTGRHTDDDVIQELADDSR